ncbi:hypothetical protein Ppro_1077 [Pelobacter propionicus DSM 2379]|uniref:Uncharacterized protein n=1 Tax=Pelobacter propionicus (strain DSM 2379 / NBRC 103807 / OttBd1) TaxID=338966 RepID=A1AMY2_PELPD|nr:hypothetical protein Ppro_1077 [Pelobacter propionicus DSM 2379]
MSAWWVETALCLFVAVLHGAGGPDTHCEGNVLLSGGCVKVHVIQGDMGIAGRFLLTQLICMPMMCDQTLRAEQVGASNGVVRISEQAAVTLTLQQAGKLAARIRWTQVFLSGKQQKIPVSVVPPPPNKTPVHTSAADSVLLAAQPVSNAWRRRCLGLTLVPAVVGASLFVVY